LVLIVVAVWFVFNWGYGTVIASKDGQIQLQDRQLADYKQKLDGASPDQAKARIDTLEARLARLEPRRLTETQRATLVTQLKLSGARATIALVRDVACGNCGEFIADISAAFDLAGWIVRPAVTMGPPRAPQSGLALLCSDLNNLLQDERAVVEAFRAAKIDFDLNQGPNRGRGVEILVTARAN
jgi:hypothetical protein